MEFALSIAFLVVCVKVFGPVEDWAARRQRKKPDHSPSAASAVSSHSGG
jgi:hypothetical protein